MSDDVDDEEYEDEETPAETPDPDDIPQGAIHDERDVPPDA